MTVAYETEVQAGSIRVEVLDGEGAVVASSRNGGASTEKGTLELVFGEGERYVLYIVAHEAANGRFAVSWSGRAGAG